MKSDIFIAIIGENAVLYRTTASLLAVVKYEVEPVFSRSSFVINALSELANCTRIKDGLSIFLLDIAIELFTSVSKWTWDEIHFSSILLLLRE